MGKTDHGSLDDTMPVVWIYTDYSKENENIRYIRLGLEEEGIPCRVKELHGLSAHLLAISAAKASSLGVGIGLIELERRAVLHHRDLPDSAKLIEIEGTMFNRESLRSLGTNSARFVKGTPLISFAEPEVVCQDSLWESDSRRSLQSASQHSLEVEMLSRVVVEALKALNY